MGLCGVGLCGVGLCGVAVVRGRFRVGAGFGAGGLWLMGGGRVLLVGQRVVGLRRLRRGLIGGRLAGIGGGAPCPAAIAVVGYTVFGGPVFGGAVLGGPVFGRPVFAGAIVARAIIAGGVGARGAAAMGLGRGALVAAGVGFRGIARGAVGGFDDDAALVLAARDRRAGECRAELGLHVAGDLEEGFVRGDADGADLVAGDVATAAQQRQDPARIGALAAADIHAEPHRVVEALAVVLGAFAAVWIAAIIAGGQVDQILWAGHLAGMGADQSHREVFGRFGFEQAGGEGQFLLGGLDRRHQRFDQAGVILRADGFRRGHLAPFGLDAGVAQHHFHPAAARERHDEHGGALLAGAAGAARAVLQRLGIARQFDVDDEAERGDIDAARGDIGGNADAGALVAQGLQCRVALVLAVLAGQGDGGETALDQRGVEVADIVAGGAEQHRRFRLMEAQQVDYRVLDVGRGDGDGLIGDVAMALPVFDGGDAQGVALIALGQRDDGLGHGGREQQRAAAGRGGVEDFLEVVAEAHVEHLVGFIEHDIAQGREVHGAALQMVAQAARGADDDMDALI